MRLISLVLSFVITVVASGQCDPIVAYGPGSVGIDSWLVAPLEFDDGRGPALLFGLYSPPGLTGPLEHDGVVRWDGSTWEPFGPPFPPLSFGDEVSAMAFYEGDLYVARRDFDDVLLRLRGGEWERMPLPARVVVDALALFEGELILAGRKGREILWAWDGVEWTLLATAGESDGSAHVLAVFGDDLIVGGSFEWINGVSYDGLAAWDGVEWRSIGKPAGTPAPSIHEFRVVEGLLYVRGSFESIGGVASGDIITYDGVRWISMGVTDGLYTLSEFGGRLVVGGQVSDLSGTPVENTAMWTGTEWIPFARSDRPVAQIINFKDELLVLGPISLDGTGLAGNWARGRPGSWKPLGSGFDSQATAFYVDGDRLIVGGRFRAAGGVSARCIVAWDGVKWHGLGAGLDSDARVPAVFAITRHEGSLYAGGYFTRTGAAPLSHVARWDGQQWHDVGGGVSDEVRAMTSYEGMLVVGGEFVGFPGNHIAAWNGSEWHPLGNGFDGVVHALAVHEGKLYAGGNFTASGLVNVKNVAVWTGSQWAPVGEGVGSLEHHVVSTLLSHEGSLHAGGILSGTVSHFGTENVVRWDGSTWLPVGARPEGRALSLTSLDGKLVLAGTRRTSLTRHVPTLEYWDGEDWLPFVSAITGQQERLNAIAGFNGGLAVAGSFEYIDGQISRFFSFLKCECAADCDGDGGLTFFDFLCFQNAFAASEPSADCDGDGGFTFFDFLCFQNSFSAGCS